MKKLLTLLSILLFSGGIYAQYCVPAYQIGTTSGDSITNFSLGTINASYPSQPLGYGDYTDSTDITDLKSGQSYTATIVKNVDWSMGVTMWIDYDDNQVFDPSEQLGFSYSGDGNGILDAGDSLFITFTVPPTATLDTLRLRVRGVFANQNPTDPCISYTFGEAEDYSVFILPPDPIDVGVSALQDIVSGICGYSAQETIRVELTNFGSLDQTNVLVSYSVNGSTPVTQTYSDSLFALGGTDTLTFNTLADLSTPGTDFTIQVWTTLAGDTSLVNDTLTVILPATAYVSPFTEAFESFTNDGNFSGDGTGLTNGWTNTPTGPTTDFNWSVRNGPTGNTFSGTGPTVDHTLGTALGTYMYTESSWGFIGDSAILRSPCIEIDSFARLSFWYHMAGVSTGTLKVYVDDGTTITNVWELSGPQQPNNLDPWLEALIDMSAYGGGSVNLIFVGVRDNSFTSDMAIDDVNLFVPPPIDMAAVEVVTPNAAACYTPAEDIIIQVRNEGNNVIDFSVNPMTVTVDVTGASTQNFSTTVNTGTLAVLGTQDVLVTSAGDFSAVGIHAITATVAVAADTVATNDSTFAQPEQLPVVTAPYFEDFETFIVGGNGTIQNNNGWTSTSSAGPTLGWTAELDGTANSFGTGPIDDHTPGGLVYLYTETSGGVLGDSYDLLSPCIDVSTLGSVKIEFWYHMFGNTMGNLETWINNGGVLTKLDEIIGQQQTAEGSEWLKRTICVPPNLATGAIQIVFRGIRGNGFASDMSIDDVSVDTLPPVDLAATAIVEPNDGCLTANEDISVVIRNLGALDVDFSVTNATLNVDITDGVNTQALSATLNTGTISSCGSDTFTVSGGDFTAGGLFDVIASIAIAADADSSNDTTTKVVNSVPLVTAPFFEDFESFTVGGNGTIVNAVGWTSTSSAGATLGWTAENDGVFNSGGTGPLDDHTPGGQVYVYTETSGGVQGDFYDLISPCIDISNLPSTQIEFWYHMFGAAIGALEVWVNEDGVLTKLDEIIGQQQTAEGDEWLKRTICLPDTIGASPFQLVFRGIRGNSFTSDISIDDVRIDSLKAIDLSVSALVGPESNLCLGDNEDVRLEVSNLGANDIDFSVDNTTLTVEITDGFTSQTISTTLTSGTIQSCGVDTFTISGGDFSGGGIFTLTNSVTIAGDGDNGNDTLVTDINVLPTLLGYLYQDFENFTDDGNFSGVGTGLTEGWANDPTGFTNNYNWSVSTGGTGSFNTGPNFDNTTQTPQGTFMYTEANWGSFGDSATLFGPCVDLTGSFTPALSFAYHMFGAGIGTLEAHIRTEGGFDTTLMTLTGAQQTSSNDLWADTLIDISPFIDSTVQVYFLAIRGNSFLGDMGLDDVRLFNFSPRDGEIRGFLSPVSGCGLSDSAEVTVWLTNIGTVLVDTMTISVSADGSPFATEILIDTINPGDTLYYTLTNTVDLSTTGPHEVTAVISANGDVNNFNDTLTISVLHKVPISTFPYVQDFENGGNLPAGWENLAEDGLQDWTFITGSQAPPFGYFGPTLDNTQGLNGLGHFAFVEDGFPNNNDSVVLISPCFDISGMANPRFSFFYWSNNPNTPNDENELHLDMFFNGDVIFDLIPPIAHKGPGWNKIEIPLSLFPGVIGFRFRVNNNNNFGNHDFAIDDFRIDEILPQDAGVSSLVAPLGQCGLGANEDLVVAVSNFGTDSITSFTVNWTINNGPVQSQASTVIIPPNGASTVTIPNQNFSPPGPYEVVAWTTLAGDVYGFNDTSVFLIQSEPSANIPITDNFDSYPAFTTVFADWQNDPNADMPFQVNSGGTGSLNTGPLGDVNGSGNYIYTEASGSANGDQGILRSGCVDLTNTLNPNLFYAYHFYGNGIEFVRVDVITSTGTVNLATYTGTQQTANGDPWINDTISLAPYIGQVVEIVFTTQVTNAISFTFEGDASLDDLSIRELLPNDVGVTAKLSPSSSECSDDSTTVAVEVVNFGTLPQSNIPVTVDITDATGTPVASLTGTVTGPLAPADTTTLVVGTFNSNAGGLMNFASYTGLTTDQLALNDSLISATFFDITPPAPIAVDDTVILCDPDSAVLAVVNDPNYTYIWYDSVGGNAIAVDTNQITTPFLNQDQTFYVSAIPAAQPGTITISEIDLSFPDFVEIQNVSGAPFDATGFKVVLSDAYADINVVNSLTWDLGLMATDTVMYREDATGANYWGNNIFWNPGAYPTFTGWAMIIDTVGKVVDAVFVNWLENDIAAFNATVAGFTLTGNDIPWEGDGVDASTTVGPLTRQGNTDTDTKDDWVDNLASTAGTADPGLLLPFFIGGGCESDLTPITVSIQPAMPDLGPDGVECQGLVLDASDPSFVSYIWNGDSTITTPTFTANTPGTFSYSVTVVNTLGCDGSDTVSLVINPQPTVDLGPDTTECNEAILDAGNPGATYIWSEPGQFGQTLSVTQSGIYSVTVNLAGCEEKDTVTVTIQPGPTVDLGVDLAACDPVTLDAGNPGSNYLWSNGDITQTITYTPPTTGSDTISVIVSSANGCESFDTVIVSEGVLPTVDLGADQTACDSVALDAGNPGFNYLWAPGGETTQTLTATASGQYVVTVENPTTGCENTDTVDVVVNTKPTADFVIDYDAANSTSTSFVYNFTNNSTGGVDSVKWDFGDGTGTSTDLNPSYAYPIAGGLFQVTLIVFNDCGTDTLVDIVGPTDLEDDAFGKLLSVYPNPTDGEFFVELVNGPTIFKELKIQVSDARGRIVYRFDDENVMGGFRHKIDISKHAEGVYNILITDGNLQTIKRIVKE
ncbi:MAG: GEVED domain-containing protein [Bacteroidota bacterium]